MQFWFMLEVGDVDYGWMHTRFDRLHRVFENGLGASMPSIRIVSQETMVNHGGGV